MRDGVHTTEPSSNEPLQAAVEQSAPQTENIFATESIGSSPSNHFTHRVIFNALLRCLGGSLNARQVLMNFFTTADALQSHIGDSSELHCIAELSPSILPAEYRSSDEDKSVLLPSLFLKILDLKQKGSSVASNAFSDAFAIGR